MRVALVHPFFWPEVRRGAERLARELADGLIARGHEVRLLTSHRGPRSEDVEDGLAIVRLPRPGFSLARLGVDEPVAHLPGVLRELRADPPDVATALLTPDALAAKAAGVPTVFAAMGIPTERALEEGRAPRLILREAARRADAAVALSEAAADGFRRLLDVPDVRVIGAPVDVEVFTPDPEARSAVPTIVCAAAPDEARKRVRLLVAAFDLVRQTHPDARLVLDVPRSPHRLAMLEAHPGVELRRMDDQAVLRDLYREAWVSVLPSMGEAFGLVLAEALACGTPVVAHDSGGMPEVLSPQPEQVGRLFSGARPRDLADALTGAFGLIGGDGLVAACRARAERFATPRFAAAYEELYTTLLGR